MPMYDWECPAGHRFESVVLMAYRDEPLACQADDCVEMATRIEISHSNPAAMIDYGFGLNREALEKGTYDPLKPVARGCRHRKGEST
jgi:hypothetical protein